MSDLMFGTWSGRIQRVYLWVLHVLAIFGGIAFMRDTELRETVLLYLFIAAVSLIIVYWLIQRIRNRNKPARVEPTVKDLPELSNLHTFPGGLTINLDDKAENQLIEISKQKGRASYYFWEDVQRVYNRKPFRNHPDKKIFSKIHFMAMREKENSPSPITELSVK